MGFEKFRNNTPGKEGYGEPVVTMSPASQSFHFNKDASVFFDGVEYVVILTNQETREIAFQPSVADDSDSYSVVRNSGSLKVSGLKAITELGYTHYSMWDHKETVPVEQREDMVVADVSAIEGAD